MKRFEAGKTYKVNGPGYIRVSRRTEHFIDFSRVIEGKESKRMRKRIYQDNLFGLGENILIPAAASAKYFVFAAHESC